MQFWAVIVDSFRESVDRKIFWVMLAISVLMMLIMASFGFDGQNITVLFGYKSYDINETAFNGLGEDFLIGLFLYTVFHHIVGKFGILLMLVATAGVFPAMIQNGVVSVLISKPISRPRLFLYKYTAAMVFVLVQASFFVGGTFFIMGLRWEAWRPGYLLAIPALVLLFSYIFCVSVVIGLKTRSAIASVLVSVSAWVAFSFISTMPQLMELQMMAPLKNNPVLYNSIRIVSWIPPKTADTTTLVAKWADAPTGGAMISDDALAGANQADLEAANRIEEQEMNKSFLASIGSSLAFEAVFVCWGMWMFSRRDF